MTNRTRALAIGLIGPAISSLGLALMFLEAFLDPTPDTATLRYFAFDSAHLMIVIGVMLSVLCAPLAIGVARASPEEVEMPVFAPEDAEDPEAAPAGERRLATE